MEIAPGISTETLPPKPTDPTDPTDPGTDEPGTDEPGTGAGSSELQAALNDAKEALAERSAAYASNDLVAAAEADKKLTDALERALAASE